MKNLRPTWLEIDLNALKHNIREVRSKLDNSTDIMAIVKANAYGHGTVEIAKAALYEGINWFGVATVAEGIELRNAGIDANILVLGTLLNEQIDNIVKYNLTPTVYDYNLAKELSKLGKDIKIHIKIDTGMGRIGFLPKNAKEEIKRIFNLPNIKIEGLFTHFAKADTDKNYTLKQLKRLNKLIKTLEEDDIRIPIIHSSNSAAIINFPEAHYNLVRMGIILYGLYPDNRLVDKLNLKPVLSWKAKLVHVKEIEKGRGISYGCTYITKSKTKVGTLPVGYHDGYSRSLSAKAEVLFNGNRSPVIGTICMDQMMIDLTGLDAKAGDIVTLIGKDKEEEVSVNELATKLDTINYEIISRIAPRVPRVFYENGEIIAIKEG
ncbi:alanine racemase [Orenia marismortui]|uniref:alanine racemase n=1 Tax=Orenia marismortui TaxID=46469 RepID=UPI0003669E3B|nr:alanine racemase [Orenia marismortui]